MIKIVLVDDHKIVRAGIKSLLETAPEYKVSGEYQSAEKFLRIVKNSTANLVITEMMLPGKTGVELIRDIKKMADKKFKVLVLTGHDGYSFIKSAFEAGADGYLLKDCNKEELFAAVVKIMNGENYCSSTVSHILMNRHMSKSPMPLKLDLSGREKEIIRLISLGYNNKEIADRLFVSARTVESHRAALLGKLKAKNAAEMIRKALEMKIIE